MDSLSDPALPSTDSESVSSLLSDGSTWFNLDSPVLETDVGLVHVCFTAATAAIIIFRASAQGFSPRTQLLLWMAFLCNLLLKKLTLGYWWTWVLVLGQSVLVVLFLPNLRKHGIVIPYAGGEKVLVAFIFVCCALVGVIHWEKTTGNGGSGSCGLQRPSSVMSSSGGAVAGAAGCGPNSAPSSGVAGVAKSSLQYITPYMSSLYGLLGEDSFHTNSKNALQMAHNESVLRSNPGLIAFLVGFKRSLEGLAILPQYRASLFVDGTLDWRVYR